jgi:hypothetical protein
MPRSIDAHRIPWPGPTLGVMADHDRAASRREIIDALVAALDRRHEVLDAIVDADHRAAAVEAVAAVLGTTRLGAEAVVGMPFYQLTHDSRRRIAAELDDLDSRLTFTLIERPESSGQHLMLRPFSSETDRDLFGARTADIGAAGVGSGGPAGSLDDEIRSALGGSTPRTPCGWSPKWERRQSEWCSVS